MRLCDIVGCSEKHFGRGLCRKHYHQKYYVEHKEEIIRKTREYHLRRTSTDAAYKEARLIRARAYGVEHREERAASSRKHSRTPKGRFAIGQIMARKRGLVWALTFDQYCELIKAPCYYCDVWVEISGIGLDRKNNDRGYAFDNVVSCCGNCNKLKNNLLTVDETKLLITVLKNLRGGRAWR